MSLPSTASTTGSASRRRGSADTATMRGCASRTPPPAPAPPVNPATAGCAPRSRRACRGAARRRRRARCRSRAARRSARSSAGRFVISTVADIGSVGHGAPAEPEVAVRADRREVLDAERDVAALERRRAAPRAVRRPRSRPARDHDHARVEPHAFDGGEAELEPAADLEAGLRRTRRRRRAHLARACRRAGACSRRGSPRAGYVHSRYAKSASNR